MLLVPARSSEEAYLFAQLRPCECGEVTSDWELTGIAPPSETTLGIDLSTRCPGCGLSRTIAFALPVRRTQVPSPHFALREDPPSSLFDPAEWFMFSHLYREQTDFGLAAGAMSCDEPAQWQEVLAQLTRAAAAMDEVLRFLPAGADAMPMEACFSPAGRALREAEPQWFTREWLMADRDVRWQAVRLFLTEFPEPAATEDDQPPPTSRVTVGLEPPILPARSEAEALLYLRLHPCACGESEFERVIGVGADEGGPLLRLTGPCLGCGEDREYLFRVPEEDLPPLDPEWALSSDPSQLIDAGEWLLVTQALVADRPLEEDLSTDDEVQRQRYDVARAAAAIDEVLKFVPADAEAVPPSAFWTRRGREFRDAQPSLFDLDRLHAVRTAYRSRGLHGHT